MIRLAKIAALHEMREVTHRGDEAVSESRHVPYTGTFGGVDHCLGVRMIQGKGFFTKHVFAMRDGRERNGFMREVRRSDDDRLNLIALYDVFEICGGNRYARLLSRAFERGGVGVAQGNQLYVRAQGQARQMILECNAPATDDGKVQCAHD